MGLLSWISTFGAWGVGLYQDFLTAVAGSSDVMRGAVSLWLLSAFGYIGRGVPAKVGDLLQNLFVVTVGLRNDGWVHDTEALAFKEILHWIGQRKIARISQSRQVVFHKGVPTLGPAYGRFWFFYKDRLYWYNRMLETNGSSAPVDTLRISTFGRNLHLLENLLQEIMPNRVQKLEIHSVVLQHGDYSWGGSTALKVRPRHTVILTDGVATAVEKSLERFREGRAWYDQRHLAYKVTIVFKGPSGTGKSSIIRMLASELERDIYQINLNKHGAQLQVLLAGVPPGSIVAVEDFDDVRAAQTRNLYDGGNTAQVTHNEVMSLSDILNALDGVAQLDDLIIVLTSNHIDKIDPALLRPGRVDAVIDVAELDDPAIHRYIAQMYSPEAAQAVSAVRFAPVRGCELHGHFLNHSEDPDAFVAALARADARVLEAAE